MVEKAPNNFQRRVLGCICLGLSYFCVGILGTKLALPPGYATAVFPAAGIALFAILWRGYSLWPGILLGSFCMNFWISFQNDPDLSFAIFLPVGLAIGLGASGGALAGAYTFKRLSGTNNPLERVFTVVVFAIFSAAMNGIVSATVGTTSLCLAQFAPWNKFFENWFTWWLGDAIGVLIFAPMLIVTAKLRSFRYSSNKFIEATLLLFFILIVCEGVFGTWFANLPHSLIFLIFPTLIWFAFRLDEPGTMVGIGLVFLIATWGTINGNGPFVSNRSVNESLLLLQIFLGSITLFTLFFTANLNEKKQIESSLDHLSSEMSLLNEWGELLDRPKKLFPDLVKPSPNDEVLNEKLFVLPILFGLTIVIFTIFLWRGLNLEEDIKLKRRVESRVEIIKDKILSDIQLQILDLNRIASRWGHQGELRQLEWENDIHLHLNDYPVYQAISWVDAAFRVRWILPLKGNEKAVGLDLTFEKKRRQTLLKVKENRNVGITPVINLVQGGKGFNVYVPVYFGDNFGGLIGGLFRIKKLFDFILSREILEDVSVAIYNGKEEIYRQGSPSLPNGDSFLQKEVLSFYDVNWRLELWPNPEFHKKFRSYKPEFALILGFFAALIITFATYFAQKEQIRAKQLENEIEKTKQAEKKILLAKVEAEQANKAKSLFLANMSHEIRTPMNAILGYSQILFRNKNLDSKTREAIKTIDDSGKNLLKMINEVLDISKIEAGKMELHLVDFDLKGLVDSLSSMFNFRCDQKGLEWTFRGFSSPVFVRGDENKLRQVLINLLGNAIKFTDSGSILFTVVALDKDQYRFNVIDTGSGIPAEAQEKIFDAFQQDEQGAKKGGTGLGLAIAKKQLEIMGADLFLISKVNEGSHFYFNLRLPKFKGFVNQSSNASSKSILHLAPGYRVKALVVDDIKENRDVVSELLVDIGAEIIEAENGKEGVEKTKECRPDIVFMDLRMPIMRGEDALKAIQQEFGKNGIKIVAITASVIDRNKDYYLSMGFHEYISKPFGEEEIFNCLNKLLDVEFVYDDTEGSQEELILKENIDLSQFCMPEKLYESMKEYANLNNMTELERSIEELKSANASEELIGSLLDSLKKYDMDGILKTLEAVSKREV